MFENVAAVGELTQWLIVQEKKNSELKSKNFLTSSPLFVILFLVVSQLLHLSNLTEFKKFKEEVVAKKATITRLEERCQAKNRSIED